MCSRNALSRDRVRSGKKLMVVSTIFFTFAFFLSPFSAALETIDRAELLLENGQTEEALVLLVPLLESKDEEELSQASELLYRIYYEKGEYDKAIEALEAYIQKFPGTSTSYLYLYWIAKLEEERQNIDRSLTLLKKLVEAYSADPNFEDPYNLKCQAQEDIAYAFQNYKKEYTQAIQAYEKVLSCIEKGEKPRIMMEIASCYEKMGEISQAQKQYEKIIKDSQDEFYIRWSKLRIKYLTEKPNTTEKSPEILAQKLTQALKNKDMLALEKLAKKGDFWTGVNFSEFEVDEFSEAKVYIAQHLTSADELQIEKDLKQKNGQLVLRIENWPDPEYDILYLVIEQGVYGWEWKGIILSSTQLEEILSNP